MSYFQRDDGFKLYAALPSLPRVACWIGEATRRMPPASQPDLQYGLLQEIDSRFVRQKDGVQGSVEPVDLSRSAAGFGEVREETPRLESVAQGVERYPVLPSGVRGPVHFWALARFAARNAGTRVGDLRSGIPSLCFRQPAPPGKRARRPHKNEHNTES